MTDFQMAGILSQLAVPCYLLVKLQLEQTGNLTWEQHKALDKFQNKGVQILDCLAVKKQNMCSRSEGLICGFYNGRQEVEKCKITPFYMIPGIIFTSTT